MSACLSDVIDVLEAAYPPGLAQDWDSVGLVCGDPGDDVDSVTIAVDATAAVVDEVPDRGLLLAHHPLLLRGVDTVAASTAKGALLHRLIRGGRALFTAHTNADSASPGVSDALADALGLTVEEVLAPAVGGPDMDKWVVYVPAENADAVREAMFAAGAGHIGDYSHCSWARHRHRAVPRLTRAHRRRSAASGPSNGSPRTASRSSPPPGCAAMCSRRCGPRIRTRSRHSTSSRWHPFPPTSGWAASGRCRHRRRWRRSSLACTTRCPARHGAIRASGEDDAEVSRVAVCGGAGDSLLDTVAGAGVDAYVTADLRHHPADEHRRRSDVALIDVAHWASEFPWCNQAAGLLRGHFGDSLPVRVSAIRTDPWNIERNEL